MKIILLVIVMLFLNTIVLATPPTQEMESCENIGEIRCSPNRVEIQECKNHIFEEFPDKKLVYNKVWVNIRFCEGYCEKETITCKESEKPKRIGSNFLEKFFNWIKYFFSF